MSFERVYIPAATLSMVFRLNSLIMSDIGIVPSPKYSKKGKATFRFVNLSMDFPAEASDPAATSELKRFFGKSLVKGKAPRSGGLTIHGSLTGKDSFVDSTIPLAAVENALHFDEGYVLLVRSRKVEIVARTKAGVFYAIATLLQLVEEDGRGYTLPEIAIADYPSMTIRGISDDISRGQISTMANFRKIIRFLAMHKMNAYMPYIENQFAFKSYPGFSEGRDPLTAEEAAELDAYGKKYHVQIIPAFETLGHMEDVLQKPEFEKYAEFPGAASLNISDGSSFEFMRRLLTEIAPAFSSPYFNMTADESSDVGLGASKKLVETSGISGTHAQYYLRLFDVLKSLGKKVMMYGDILLQNPKILELIPKDVIIIDWHYSAAFEYPSIKVLKEAGFNFIACPAVWNFSGPFPNFHNSLSNIREFTRQSYLAGALGTIVSTWNDNGGAELRELNYPGYAWGAECAWNPEGADPARFEAAFFRHFFKTESSLPRIAHELLSSVNNQITWHEFWRAPFMHVPAKDAALRVESVSADMPVVHALAIEAGGLAGANRDILGIYRLVASMNKYWSDKVKGIKRMREVARDPSLSHRERNAEIKKIERNLLIFLGRIRKDYVRIYLRTNRRRMLHLIESRFDGQAAQLKSGTREMLKGNADYDQTMQSGFIYYPDSLPYASGGIKVGSATFMKTISLSRKPATAMAQVIGDTYCQIFVNGRFAGSLNARRTLTWNVEFTRVKVFDISKLLKRGSNTIEIHAVNYDRNGSAGCNFYAVIEDEKIMSDGSWQVVKGNILSRRSKKGRPPGAMSYDNGWTISAPDFSLGLKSWIER